MTRNIILIGFKNVGKSAVGRALAADLGLEFIDLDLALEAKHRCRRGFFQSCREIVRTFGEDYFRALESEALAEALTRDNAVVAVGGGAPLSPRNMELMRGHLVIHLTAGRGVVFESIMSHGVPAFFSANKDPYICFTELWEERLPVYRSVADCAVDNNGALESAVRQIKQLLKDHHYAAA